MEHVDLTIDRAETHEDYAACVELQRQVWGFRANEDISGQTWLMLANKFGGSVLIARNLKPAVIGFAFAMPAWRDDQKPFWWSHMTAVLPEYQRHEVGWRLKLRQREEALSHGIDRIEWTFDPLQAMNAYFNLRKLGATVSEYEDNVYGFTSSPLHQGLPTDRFVAKWQLNSTRVQERVAAAATAVLRDVDALARINPGGELLDLGLDGTLLALEIPVDVASLKSADLSRAAKWQERLRTAAHHYFSAGYTITDFVLSGPPIQEALYILER